MPRHVFRRFVMMLICSIVLFTVSCFTEAAETKIQQQELKSACLSATLTAISLEIHRYEQWIDLRKKQGNYRDLPELQLSLNSLKVNLEKYRNMDIEKYVLPEKVSLKAWVQNKADVNSLLYVEGMTKIGPFYHLAGIIGDNYAALRPQDHYVMTLYKVYPRSYWYMESDYVYIAELSKNEKN